MYLNHCGFFNIQIIVAWGSSFMRRVFGLYSLVLLESSTFIHIHT